MSPVARVSTWRDRSPRPSPTSSNVHPTPSSSNLAGRAGPYASSPTVDLDGTTLIDLGEDAEAYNLKSSGHSKSRKSTDREEVPFSQRTSFDDAMIDETVNEETLQQPTSKYDDLAALSANQAELELDLMKKRALTTENLKAKGWTQAEIDLYLHIEMRGYESLLPASWEMDFNTLPEALFAGDEEEAYIRALGDSGRSGLGTSDFRAQKALHHLIGLGAKIRDKMLVGGKQTEIMAKKEIMKYLRWSLVDAGFDSKKNAAELVVVEARIGQESPKALQARMRERLDILADKHDELIDGGGDLPALYGILLTHTVMLFIGYDPNSATGDDSKDLRTIATFNFRERDYDVWNSLAIAIVAMHTREQMSKMFGGKEAMDNHTVDPAA